MRYEVEVVRSAQRAVKRLPAEYRERVARAIEALGDNPRPRGSQKLSGFDGWRLRVGEYRIMYTVSDRARYVQVQWIARRTTTTYD
ncbi:MAG: type II toxin-antitoxin system RelE/ParE family toxin [Chloroflexi bacterium]|nr:type II toxin-antitoxin system RelE/ParE family toxin [Chloroflexota bacterium]